MKLDPKVAIKTVESFLQWLDEADKRAMLCRTDEYEHPGLNVKATRRLLLEWAADSRRLPTAVGHRVTKTKAGK